MVFVYVIKVCRQLFEQDQVLLESSLYINSNDFLAKIISLLAFLNFQQVTSNSASDSVHYNSFTTERYSYIRLHANSRKYKDFVSLTIISIR